MIVITLLLVATTSTALAATWQYRAGFDRGPDRRGQAQQAGDVLLWLPPESQTVRAVLLCGRLGIEGELIVDPAVRQACRDCDIAIVYFTPHLSGVFHYWEPGNRDGDRLLKALDDLARCSGRDELRRVPWITAGHSTAGIFARNVAYWKPERTAAVIHIKSGNFHQAEHLPPQGSLAGIPLLAINGQFETFGPEGGIRPEYGRQTQWVFVRSDIRKFRERDPNHLMSLLVHPGADHFHGSPELGRYVAMFLRKTVEYRVPAELPPGKAPVSCLPLVARNGWLSDDELDQPRHPAASWEEYTGERTKAFWHYDEPMAQAAIQFDHHLAAHQVLSNPTCTWLDADDGWTFRADAQWLDTMPEQYGGQVGGRKVGHASTPFVYRCKPNEPVQQVGPDGFRLLRPVKRVHIAAYHPGDEQYRSTIRWGSIDMPGVKDAARQTIDFPPVKNLSADAAPVRLGASATSGLPVDYEVDYGPVVVEDGKLVVSEIPPRARFPIPCRVTAWQIGRRTAPSIAPAEPVSVTFEIHPR